jgi:cytosine/adenosine deaminase-related metal-dependent hydrolase
MLTWNRPIAFVNARVVLPDLAALASSVRIGARVLDLDVPPRSGDLVVDLDGAFVLPGLINAHDHLELNHYGRLKRRDRYENARDWIEDLRPALQADDSIRQNTRHSLSARLFIGGLKNLLAGATTVAHHNPRYREIGRQFPVRVIKRYGWAHSFSLEQRPVGAHGEPGGDVRERCLATPSDAPFMIHVAEGIDAAAAAELSQLDRLGCLRRNTVLVHGVALTPIEFDRVVERGASLVWCPASNAFLFRRTAPVRGFLDRSERAAAHVCLGSDSRVTGARDLLDEIRAAAAVMPVMPRELFRMVTTAPARILHLHEAGRIAIGSPADLVVLPSAKSDPAEALLAASRRDLSLVMIDGRPLVGSPAFETVFGARRSKTRPIVLDGAERVADATLAGAIRRCPISEPGLECWP